MSGELALNCAIKSLYVHNFSKNVLSMYVTNEYEILISGFLPYTLTLKHNRFMYVHLYCRRFSMQEASEFSYDYRAFIFEFDVQTSCVLSQFQELGTS